MNIRVETTAPCRRQVHVEIPVEQVNKEFAETVEAYAGVARIPGFRPGRAPKDLVKRRFAKDIREEVKNRLVPQGYQEAVKKEKLQAVSVLDVKENDLSEGKPFSFSITLDVAPEFELPAYKGLKLEGKKIDVTDADIDEVIKTLREQNARFEDIPAREVVAGDMVQVDFDGTCEGKSFAELSAKAASLGQAKDFWIIADAENEFLPGFAAGLTGSKPGDQRTIEVTFPATFIEPSVAGKTAKYEVSVKALREKRLPEIDAEFVKSLGVEDVAKLRERIGEDLKQVRVDNERSRVEGEIVRQLVTTTKLDIPDSLLQEETQQAVYDIVRSNTNRGVGKDEIETNKEKIIETASQTSAERIKARYVLRRIADEEKIVATEEEIGQRIVQLAQRYRTTPDRLQKELEENNAIGRVADEVRLMKTVTWLHDQASITAV